MRIFLSCWLMLSVLSAQAGVLDDPMRPPGYARAGMGKKVTLKKGWQLSAIRIDANRRFAIINGRTLETGEWVNKARVVEILPQKVRLKNAQGEFAVRLVKTRVKKTRVIPNNQQTDIN